MYTIESIMVDEAMITEPLTECVGTLLDLKREIHCAQCFLNVPVNLNQDRKSIV